MTHRFLWTAALAFICFTLAAPTFAQDQWASYPGKAGPGKGKNIVLNAGDEEYRSEEEMPMLGQILAQRHGFNCTVLFAVNKETGRINPNELTNIPGMNKLDAADLVIIQTRFRELPDADMKHFVDYVNSGKPIIGLRTATHAFNYKDNKDSPYAKYSYNSKDWSGGFGRQVLGETWISHHGSHANQGTRGIINDKVKDHPALRGVHDLFGVSDVYGVTKLPDDAQVLVYGEVTTGLNPADPPAPPAPDKKSGKMVDKNNPMQPVVWVREYRSESGKPARVMCSTLASAIDFENEGLRRLVVNAAYWGVGLEDKIPSEGTNVQLVGEYHPSGFHFFDVKQHGDSMPKPSDLTLGAPVGQNDRTLPGGKAAPPPMK